MNPQQFLAGDQVAIRKGLVFTHPMIHVGDGWFIEKSKTGQVRLKHASHFPAGQVFTLQRRLGPEQARDVVQRAIARLGREDYDLLRANCQHFVSEIYTGQRRSEQVEGFTLAAVLAGVVYALGALLAA